MVLFGSIARGDWDRESDVDLLLVVDGLPKDLFERDSELLPLTKDLDHAISLVCYTPEELAETPPFNARCGGGWDRALRHGLHPSQARAHQEEAEGARGEEVGRDLIFCLFKGAG